MESPEQPTLLMHYTNAEGLEGILKSKTLRLTHHNCTNDSMETIYTFNALKNLLKNNFEDIPTIFGELSEYISQQSECYVLKNPLDVVNKILPNSGIAEKIWPYLKKINIYSFFIRLLGQLDYFCDKQDWYTFSFSRVDPDKNYNFFAQNGRLSQWRAYGNYALVFTKDLLEKALKDKHEKDDVGYILEPVKYPRPDLKEISEDFKKFFETHCLNNAVNGHDDLKKWEEKMLSWIKLVAFVKHPGFEEENEERLCQEYFNDTSNEYFMEYKKNYLETNASGKKYNISMKFKTLPIEKIIIGPCKNQQEQENKEKHLKTWLEDNGYPNIEIGRSDIPYVGQYR
jgi:hypothetical protein